MNNFAFIDTQNTHRGIHSLGWEMDWSRFRIYLKDKYSVTTAYLFLGFIPHNQDLYADLQKAGFIIIFKPVIFDSKGNAKGNCDKAVIVTSDGDFYSLVKFLYEHDKLEMVLSPYVHTCSKLLKKEAKEKINYMSNLRQKIGKNRSK
jgi:hypothetical protein